MAAETKARGTFEDFEAQREQVIRTNFEPQLARLGLSKEQIETQTLDELNQSLIRINDALAHPDSFGTLKLQMTADARLFVTTARQETLMEIGIVPLLLERKSLILSRIKNLVGDRKIETLNDLVATVSDPELKAKIENELNSISEQSRRLAEQESAVAQAQAEQFAKKDEALGKLRAELLERKLKAWTGFLAKESMATYIGAFLLMVLTVVQVVAMFLGAAYKSEIINNAFLLLLGYFFGQNVLRTDSTKSD